MTSPPFSFTVQDVNAEAADDLTTPLWQAAWRGQIELVSLLVDHGAELNHAKKNTGSTPLYIASQEGNAEVVKILLDSGSEVRA